MKKTFYILAFTFLGFLVGTLVHGAVEVAVITLLVKDFSKWGLGLSWDAWFFLHHVWVVLTFAVGLAFGFKQGRYWWQRIYVQKGKS